jgi:succinylglutamic semialdehyde dehydrogenase
MSGVYIDNEWQDGQDIAFESINPADNQVVFSTNGASQDQVTQAVNSAKIAFKSWSRLSRETRIAYLSRYADELKKRADDIALAISRDTGKTLWETKTEAQAMIGKIAISTRAYNERTGAFSRVTAFGELALDHAPFGVMAVLGPFNFPGHLPNGHIVPALLAGNTIVFKPSELAPLVANIMIDAFKAAGLPKGVVNLVHGGRNTGAAVLASDINGVLFTGSAQTGTYIHKLFGGRPEIVLALEMGGNNPLIIWEPCNINAAADMIIHSSFITTGQRCSCARRIILPKGKFGDDVLSAVIEKTAKMRIGAFDDEQEPFIGPLISAQMAQNYIKFAKSLVQKGGKAIMEAKILEKGAAFVAPALYDMSDANEKEDEELFAPLAQVFRVDTFEQAIELANDTKFGLSSGLICDDPLMWKDALSQMRAGLINWNRPTTGASGELPFGGPGLSGNGRPSAFYAADYCSYPVAQQNAMLAQTIKAIGID